MVYPPQADQPAKECKSAIGRINILLSFFHLLQAKIIKFDKNKIHGNNTNRTKKQKCFIHSEKSGKSKDD
jgi:hypothetical protein